MPPSRSALALVLALTAAACAHRPAQPPAPPPEVLRHITPQQAGYSAEKLEQLRGFLAESGSQSLLLLYDGQVFFEWGDVHRKILVHSMRKALLNSLYGIYRARGVIDLDRTLAELGVDDIAPGLSDEERQATLSDVLKSRSGVYHDAAAESAGMAQGRPARGSHPHGSYYYYNNWDFNVAGALFERLSGRRIYDAFADEIARPLGMADFENRIVAAPATPDAIDAVDPRADGYYQLEPERSRYPAYHFRMSAYDLALYGQLYLDRGRWHGRQLVPADWIDLSTRPYSEVEPEYGLAYGMLWDVLVPDGDERPSFFHTGVGVHMLGVYPKHHLVLVHRVDTEHAYRFNDGDLYQLIKRVHAARVPSR